MTQTQAADAVRENYTLAVCNYETHGAAMCVDIAQTLARGKRGAARVRFMAACGMREVTPNDVVPTFAVN